MAPDKVLISIFTLAGIAFTYWFFLMRKEDTIYVSSGSVDIVVEGGYKPEVISIPVGKTTNLNFLRKDSSSCLEEIVLSDFKVRKTLPLDKTLTIPITPKNKGEFKFSCGMNMFHGKIRVI